MFRNDQRKVALEKDSKCLEVRNRTCDVRDLSRPISMGNGGQYKRVESRQDNAWVEDSGSRARFLPRKMSLKTFRNHSLPLCLGMGNMSKKEYRAGVHPGAG